MGSLTSQVFDPQVMGQIGLPVGKTDFNLGHIPKKSQAVTGNEQQVPWSAQPPFYFLFRWRHKDKRYFTSFNTDVKVPQYKQVDKQQRSWALAVVIVGWAWEGCGMLRKCLQEVWLQLRTAE